MPRESGMASACDGLSRAARSIDRPTSGTRARGSAAQKAGCGASLCLQGVPRACGRRSHASRCHARRLDRTAAHRAPSPSDRTEASGRSGTRSPSWVDSSSWQVGLHRLLEQPLLRCRLSLDARGARRPIPSNDDPAAASDSRLTAMLAISTLTIRSSGR